MAAATNLVFGATIANAATTYTPELVYAGYETDLAAPPALFNDKVITMTYDTGAGFYQLFATDRSTNTTVRLDEDLAPRYAVGDVEYGINAPFTSIQFDGKFWTWVDDLVEFNYDLMYSDGTVAGTGVVEVDSNNYDIVNMAGTTDGIYFSNTDDLFFFDGTIATDMDVTDGFDQSYPFAVRVFQDKVSFLSYNWDDEDVIQYTAVGGVKSAVGEVVSMYSDCLWPGRLYYEQQDANNAYHRISDECVEENELWWTNDPDTLYTSVTTEIGGGDNAFFNGGWYFEGDFNDNNYLGLAKAVGSTITATHEVTYPEGFVVVGDFMYFSAYNDEAYSHYNLYKLGTDGVIHLVFEDWEGSFDWPVGAGIDGAFFFNNIDDTNGEELWVDDAEGTRLASDIIPGTDGSAPYYLSVVGDEVCFGAYTADNSNDRSLFCAAVSSNVDSLPNTGVDANGIGAAGVLTLLVGGGLAIVGRRFAIAQR